MGLFAKLLKRKGQMRPRRMGMLSGLAGLKDRMRPRRNMMFGGGRQLNPFLVVNNLPRKDGFLPPISKLPPQPGGNRAFLDRLIDQPIDANIGPIVGGGLNPILGGSDYMPKVNPGMTQPIDVGGPVDPAPGMGPIMTQPIANPGQPQPIDSGPKPIDYSGYLDFYKNPPVPGRVAAPVPPSTSKPLPVMPGALSMSTGGGVNVGDLAVSAARGAYKAKTAPLQLAATVSNVIAPNTKLSRGLSKLATPFAAGGEADSSEFPDLSGDGKITQKDILMGRGVIKMQEGGDPALVDNDADFRNAQNALMNYRNFYASQPTGFQQFLPNPDDLYGDDQMSGDIDMMLQDLDSPEKKARTLR